MGVDLIFLYVKFRGNAKRKVQIKFNFTCGTFTVAIVVIVTISMNGYVITIDTVIMVLVVL